MTRFKLAPYEPYYRYNENGILYTAYAIEFKIDQVEKAFDEGLFVPSRDFKTGKPNFTRNNEPVYYLPHYALVEKVICRSIEIDNSKFTNKVFTNQDLTGYSGRHYLDCKFYDCKLFSKEHTFINCRFIRCEINGVIFSDCKDISLIEDKD